MDAVQFGRWMSQRRRECGWQSQRALVDAARQDPLLIGSGISEDFLARLEAGQLSHPYRNSVRKRVLALAWLLCKTPRDVQAYLRAAELNELSAEEADQIQSLRRYLAALDSPPPLLLPLRPSRLVGRSAELHRLLGALYSTDVNACAITGMPGCGKSALAYEAVHMLASDERERLRLFPDGMVTFTGQGRCGVAGLISLLSGITTVFHSLAASTPTFRSASLTRANAEFTNADLAYAVDQARAALAGKRVLILLDDLEPDFPLRQALQALLVETHRGMTGSGHSTSERRVVLITSSHRPPPALVNYHMHLAPLKPEAALELLGNLVGRSTVEMERGSAERICEAVGYLPLAIETVASAVLTKSIPLSLLAARVNERLFDTLLDGEGEVHARLMHALDALQPEQQEQLALLSTLGASSFGLECAAAMRLPEVREIREVEMLGMPAAVASLPEQASMLANEREQEEGAYDTVDLPLSVLANTAADLGCLVRSSLLEVVDGEASSPSAVPRYQLHPIIRAGALEYLERLDPEVIGPAQENLQAYALAYIERYQQNVPHLERERDFLLAAMERAWSQGQYAQVVQLVAGLAPIAGRLGTYEEGEHLLLCGVHASRYVGDRYHLARLLNRLGVLLCSHGELTRAQYVLKESLQIAEELMHPAVLWHPLCNLAHIAHILGEYNAARRFADVLLERMQQIDDPNGIAVALLKRGFYARLQGDLDRAYKDVNLSLELFGLTSPVQKTPGERITEMEARTEFARIKGDFIRSQEYLEATIELVQEMCDHYGMADLLYDQAYFAHQQGMPDDARALATRALDIARQIGARHFQVRDMALLPSLAV